MRRLVLFSVLFFVCVQHNVAQHHHHISDTSIKNLPDITIIGKNSKQDFQLLPEIVGTNIYAGKKNALVVVGNVQGNVVTNNMRQVLAKVAGIHIWESDPSGIQIGIAARGLSPNRSWEFNVRQNGYDIAADPFGYPEAYYNPPLQAVQRIEIVRGQGALQYGPQFGGMVNYILRNGTDMNGPFEMEINQSFGSNGMYSSFNSIGGKKGKLSYYTFLDHRNGDGWRQNSQYNTNAVFSSLTYQFNNRFSLTAEYSRSNMRSRQPGGMTDSAFRQNAQQSFRSRNWFDVTWNIPALIAQFQLNENTRWNTRLFAVIAQRNSVGFLQPVTVKDSINSATLEFNPRVITMDAYNNFGLESRFITDFKTGRLKNTLSAGVRLYKGNTFRQADGKGSTGVGYDLNVSGVFPKEISFGSLNAAAFVESVFRLTDNLLVVPGIRYEWLRGVASGRNGFNAAGEEIVLQNISRSRGFLLSGLGIEYHVFNQTELYGGISQAYRPIQFANLQAAPTTDIVDKDLKDSKGYNIDFGYRGKINQLLRFDVSAYYLQYNNRIGVITTVNSPLRTITNLGSSTSKGIESLVEFNFMKLFSNARKFDASVFGSYSFNDARYSGNFKDAGIKGKKVENAPAHIFRGGFTAGYQSVSLTTQISYVGKAFSDANNTLTPTVNGQNGLIPSYTVTDITLQLELFKKVQAKMGVNNLFNKSYFTRRAGGYPGPGLLPADGRIFFITTGIKI